VEFAQYNFFSGTSDEMLVLLSIAGLNVMVTIEGNGDTFFSDLKILDIFPTNLFFSLQAVLFWLMCHLYLDQI
jgi:hypothetical protein